MDVGNCLRPTKHGVSRFAVASTRIRSSASAEGRLDLGKQLDQRLLLLFPALFRFKRSQLLGRKLFAFRVAQNAVGGAGDMPQMKRDEVSPSGCA